MRLAPLIWALIQGAPGAPPTGMPPDVRQVLRAAVDDSAGIITGSLEVRYRHLRSDTLRSLTFALDYNRHRPGATLWPAGTEASPDRTGYHRVLGLHVGGQPGTLEWPGTPDSSLATTILPRPLAPGDSVTITLAWEGRPPALPWHRERRGRRLDLAGWYPRLMDVGAATLSPMPALGSFTVVLDLAADQVVGGTGRVACGDPGWRRVTELARPLEAIGPPQADDRRDDCGGATPGRRRVAWRADSVPEVAYAASPTFRYESGDILKRRVHALYEQGGERIWGAGLATNRAETALAWLYEVAGEYPWPELTVVEGLGRPGRGLPMILLADSPSQATLLGLVGQMYSRQVLPGSDSVLAIGAAAFQAAWFFETLGGHAYYAGIERQVLEWDLEGLARSDEPLPGAGSTSPCGSTFCRRTEFLIHQLRWWSGSDARLKELFRGHVARYRLRPAVARSFQGLARRLIRPAPDSLYRQVGPGGGVLFDDAVTGARRERAGDGKWRTVATLERRAAGLFPRTVWVVAEADTVEVRLPGLAERETVAMETRTRPRTVVLDPYVRSHDWNMINNRRSLGFSPAALLPSHREAAGYLDLYFVRRTARDRLTRGWAPAVWFNDPGGWTVGLRLREDYLGRYELNEAWAAASTGTGGDGRGVVPHGWLTLRNPVWLRAPGWSQRLSGGWMEGRGAAEIGVERRFRRGVADSTVRVAGLRLHWLTVTDAAWVDPDEYDDAGTLELTLSGRHGVNRRRWQFTLEASATGGHAHGRDAAVADGAYGRAVATAALRWRIAPRIRVGARAFAGAVVSADSVPRQRRLFLAGADPYERFSSPFLRSRGALFVRPGVHYHAPGGGGLRGLDPRVSGDRLLAGSLEVEYGLRERVAPGLLGRVALAAFLDGGLADGDLDGGGERLRAVGDAGVGLRVDHRVGRTDFQTRLELPVWVSRPAFAQDHGPERAAGVRWGFSFSPSWPAR